jgi:hypothetical protein
MALCRHVTFLILLHATNQNEVIIEIFLLKSNQTAQIRGIGISFYVQILTLTVLHVLYGHNSDQQHPTIQKVSNI